MEKEKYITRAEECMFHVYNRFPVVFDHGEGVYLYDTDGKKYLDFGSGIGVMALGYGNKDYQDPLYIIDGVPTNMALNTLNTNDIESKQEFAVSFHLMVVV